jgi:hypothetical protein
VPVTVLRIPTGELPDSIPAACTIFFFCEALCALDQIPDVDIIDRGDYGDDNGDGVDDGTNDSDTPIDNNDGSTLPY